MMSYHTCNSEDHDARQEDARSRYNQEPGARAIQQTIEEVEEQETTLWGISRALPYADLGFPYQFATLNATLGSSSSALMSSEEEGERRRGEEQEHEFIFEDDSLMTYSNSNYSCVRSRSTNPDSRDSSSLASVLRILDAALREIGKDEDEQGEEEVATSEGRGLPPRQ